MDVWPLKGDGQRWEAIGELSASSSGTLITCGAANTKGAYVELVAATTFPASGFYFNVGSLSNVATLYLIDIAVGAAASEVVLISNIHVSVGGSAFGTGGFFPLSIPAGVRISARAQDSTGASTLRIIGMLMSGGWEAGSSHGRITTYGATTADSGGIQVDPGAVINTKGAYSQITAATTNLIRQIVLGFGNQGNQTETGSNFMIDLAVGGAGSEVIVIPDFPMVKSSIADDFGMRLIPPLPIHIPAGTRLAMRAQSSTADATDRLFDAVVYGIG